MHDDVVVRIARNARSMDKLHALTSFIEHWRTRMFFRVTYTRMKARTSAIVIHASVLLLGSSRALGKISQHDVPRGIP